MLAVVTSASREIEVFDSAREYAHEMRDLALQKDACVGPVSTEDADGAQGVRATAARVE